MPVTTCSAMAAGPLPSTTQAMAGAGLVGSWGAANTAPSGLSAAVTRSAANGRAIGVAAVLVVEDAAGRVVVVGAASGVEGPELHDASTSATSASSTAANPDCRL